MFVKIYFILAFCVVLFCGAGEASPQEILVVQSMRIKPYMEAVEGFRAALNGKARDMSYVVRDTAEAADYMRGGRPDLILAVGMEALRHVKKYSRIPIVYMMVLNPYAALDGEPNVTGVGMTISPEKQLAQIRRILPGARRIALLYDPGKSGTFARRAQAAARELQLEIAAREVAHARDVPEALKSLKGAADAILLIPDTTVLTRETTELIMLFSVENALPVCAFSSKYLEMGALMSMDVSASDMGRQAGLLAARILSGTRVDVPPPVDADNPVITVNGTVARKLGIHLSDEVRARAKVIN